VTDAPSENYFQAHAYKTFPPEVGPETVRWEEGEMLHHLPLNSVIWDPVPGSRVKAGTILVRGWAMGAEGDPVAKVELSADGGARWTEAQLTDQGGPWTWSFWSAPVTLGPGRHTLVVRATDAGGRVQPEVVDRIWNFKGYMNNAWHRVSVEAIG
jgi:sulfite oxidase